MRFPPSPTVRRLLAIQAAAMMLVAAWFRCRALGTTPGVNADEAWYGVMALDLIRGHGASFHTPPGNLLSPFFFGPVVVLHLVFGPSIAVLRSVAAASGLAALVVNWLLCRWTCDRRTAAVSTVLLAVLPLNIAYSRFGWDASQSLLATLPVLYFSLALVRFPARGGRWLAAAVVAEGIAVWVHPTNVFMAPVIAAALVVRVGSAWWARPQAALAAAPLLGKMTTFVVLYAQLFTGETTYQYIAGSHSWLGGELDAAVFWLALAVAAAVVCRKDPILPAAWGVQLAGFAVVAGLRGVEPGCERYAICLVGPAVLMLSRGLAVAAENRPRVGASLLAAASLAGWFLLADFREHYFSHLQRTGGGVYQAFRTGPVDPKQAAIEYIRGHRQPGPTWIAASEWWSYWPLRYFAMADKELHVYCPYNRRWLPRTEPPPGIRPWHVDFCTADGTHPDVHCIPDAGGRTVLSVWR